MVSATANAGVNAYRGTYFVERYFRQSRKKSVFNCWDMLPLEPNGISAVLIRETGRKTELVCRFPA